MPGELFISGESECLSVEFSGVGVSVSMRMSGKLCRVSCLGMSEILSYLSE